ncbi:Rrf2 family transcriptional regulator [Enterobacter sp.]|uniref:Rrf2 family transcriptional regulator n=1 Tax=Enterobacter sp. TaxID=42895 RepID=UPI00296F14A4|nr:Rrf2 family transcriptional regulator [Enterobacter sp.]
MKKDSRLSTVLHILLHMHFHARPMTSEQLAQCAGTNPVVIRRMMGLLRKQQLVSSIAGHGGGWSLTDKLTDVTLRQLHDVLGEPAIFAIGNRNERPECLIEQAVNAALGDAFDEAEALLLAHFGRIKLGDLLADAEKRNINRNVRGKNEI